MAESPIPECIRARLTQNVRLNGHRRSGSRVYGAGRCIDAPDLRTSGPPEGSGVLGVGKVKTSRGRQPADFKKRRPPVILAVVGNISRYRVCHHVSRGRAQPPSDQNAPPS